MKRGVLLAVLLLMLSAAMLKPTSIAFAGTGEELGTSIDGLLENLDYSALEQLFNSLNDKQRSVLGGTLESFFRTAFSAEKSDYSSIFAYCLELLGVSIKRITPLVISIFVAGILVSVVGGLKGSFASKSVDAVVNFAGVTTVAVMVVLQVFGVIRRVITLLEMLKVQMHAVFPILFTLMTALGASGSIAAYQPAVALISFVLTDLITVIILPIIIINVVLSVVGNLSATVKLDGARKFFSSSGKWILGTSFFLFSAFLSIKGVTAAVYDGVSVRTTKFALSKYVPVIGGYLAEGFNLVLAGSVLLKNAIGSCAIFIMIITVLPVLLEIILLSLALKLSGALTEPFSGGGICSMVNSVSSAMGMLVAVVLGAAFLYFIFLLLIVCSGNLAL